jgi:hypothetical protein
MMVIIRLQEQGNQGGDIVITKFRQYTGEKGLDGKSADDIPAVDTDVSGIPISEPDLDNPSAPPEASDRPWLV